MAFENSLGTTTGTEYANQGIKWDLLGESIASGALAPCLFLDLVPSADVDNESL